jgi:hypothetical protein
MMPNPLDGLVCLYEQNISHRDIKLASKHSCIFSKPSLKYQILGI